MGGRQCGPFFRDAACRAPSGTAIVEIGCWLGAGTAQLALGVRKRSDPQSISIHCFDRWTANKAEAQKALTATGLELAIGQDTLALVQQTLRPFGADIQFHQGDLKYAGWDGRPISVYIDDAAKRPKQFYRALRTFGPSWIPGSTVIVLMDYRFWLATGDEENKCQMEFIENYPEHFSLIADLSRFCSAFRYVKPLDFAAALWPRRLRWFVHRVVSAPRRLHARRRSAQPHP
jgi:hypothetical protein